MYPAGVHGVRARTVDLATGVKLRLVESGPPHAPPLILLHGWGACLYGFRHAMTRLPDSGLRVIAVDLRGHGLSDHPRHRDAYSLDAYCNDVDALLDYLRLPAAALGGHSMGGGVALHYALRRPDRVTQLALINPTGLVPVAWVMVMRAVPRIVMRIGDRRLAPRWLVALILRHLAFAYSSRVSNGDVDEYWSATQISGYALAIRACIGEFDWSPLTDAQAASLDVPTTVVLGSRDSVVRNAHPSAQRLRGAKVHTIDGGHCVHEERPEVVYDIVADALRDRVIARPSSSK